MNGKNNNFHQLQSSELLWLERGKDLGCELRYLSTKFQWFGYRSHLPGDMGGSDTIGVPSDTSHQEKTLMLPVLLETRSAESARRKSATPGAAVCSQVLLEG